MTYNNTSINPHPLANPFNSRAYCNNNNSMWNQSGFRRCDSNTQVPYSKPFSRQDKEYWDDVHTPCQNQIPMGSENKFPHVFSNNIMRLPDGSMIDINTKKLIKTSKYAEDDSWGSAFINQIEEETWDNNVCQNVTINGNILTNNNSKTIAFREQKEKEIMQNQSKEQCNLVNALEHGYFFPLSKLKECGENEW